MKTINNIIKEIENLESDFELFNSRLIEFANSTNKSDIDPMLLKKYINSLNNYKKLSKKYKDEINSGIRDKDLDEYKSQKKLVIFRLDKLNKLFENNLAKLKLILNSVEIKDNKKRNIDIDFNSSAKMIEIERNLYKFYNNYNKNIEFQKYYNLNINLDNKYEAQIEKKLNSLELIKSENKYMSDLNNIFEELELLNSKFYDSFKRLSKYEDTIFVNLDILYKFYFPEKSQHYVFRIFNKKLKDSYVMSNFDVASSDLKKDFNKFKSIINLEIKKFDFLVKFYDFGGKYDYYKKLSKKYELFTNLTIFDLLFNKFNSINKNSFSSVSELINYINNGFYKQNGKFYGYKIITRKLKLFNNIISYLNKFDDIYKNKSDDFNYSFFTNLYSILSNNDTKTENYIKTGLHNIGLELNKNISNPEYRNINEFSALLLKLNNDIIKRKYNLNFISKYITHLDNIVLNIKYKSGLSLSKYKKSAENLIKKLNLLLMIDPKSMLAIEFKNYIIENIILKYRTAKKTYYANLNYNSGGGSSYSSSGSSYSSSYSSSSSSYSSSYSSSGSSSW